MMPSPKSAAEYALSVWLDVPYTGAVERATAALKEEGFGILTQIDVRATLKQKLDVDFRDYVILGACSPPLAHRALQADLDVIDPLSMLAVLDHPALEPIASEAKERLARVIQRLGA